MNNYKIKIIKKNFSQYLNRQPSKNDIDKCLKLFNKSEKKFINSFKEEYNIIGNNRNISKEEFVKNIYKKLLNRNPDTKGLNYYVKMLKKNNKEYVINELKKSEEYKKFRTNLEDSLEFYHHEIKIPDEIYIYHENLNSFDNYYNSYLNKLKSHSRINVFYKIGSISKRKINFIRIKNLHDIYSDIINNKISNDKSFTFIINKVCLFFDKNVILDHKEIKSLFEYFNNSNCDILSPLIKHNGRLIYYGGFINNDNQIYYINSNDVSYKTKNLHFVRSSLVHFKDLYICNIDNYIKLNENNDLYNIIKNLNILFNPFINFQVKHNQYNFKFLLPFSMEKEAFRTYLKLNNKRFLYSFKILNYKFLNFNNKKNILIIENSVPTVDKDCGSKYIYNFIKSIKKMNFNVFYFQYNFCKNWFYIDKLRKEGVYVNTCNEKIKEDNDLKKLLKNNYNLFDYIFVSRLDKIKIFYDIIRKYNSKSKLIFQTHDLSFLRENRIRKIKGYSYNKDLENEELHYINSCDQTIVVSNIEHKLLIEKHNVDSSKVFHLPIMFEDSNNNYYNSKESKDFVFIGSHHTPNIDAVNNFLENYFEKIIQFDNSIIFNIIGRCCNYISEHHKNKFKNNLILHGIVSDNKMIEIFKSCRLSIAPLRYGAGVKGKLIDSFNLGIPVITSEIGAEGIEVENNKNIIIIENDDNFPKNFIENYNNLDKLNIISKNSINLFKTKYSVENQISYAKNLMNKIDSLNLPEFRKKSNICIINFSKNNNHKKILNFFDEVNNNYFYELISVSNENLKINERITILKGNNNYEFQVYNQVINYIFDKKLINKYSHFIIINDTFYKNGKIESLININYDVINEFFNNNNVYGVIDTLNRDFKLDNFIFRDWIRTNFIVIPQNILYLLKGNLIRFIISNTFDNEKNLKIHCDTELFNFIKKWLSIKENNIKNFEILVNICHIFNQYYLTHVLRSKNINIIKIRNYL